MGPMRYGDQFWSVSDWEKIAARSESSLRLSKKLSSFLKKRADLEKSYAAGLTKLVNQTIGTSKKYSKSVGGSAFTSFETILNLTGHSAHQHEKFAAQLNDALAAPLLQFYKSKDQERKALVVRGQRQVNEWQAAVQRANAARDAFAKAEKERLSAKEEADRQSGNAKAASKLSQATDKVAKARLEWQSAVNRANEVQSQYLDTDIIETLNSLFDLDVEKGEIYTNYVRDFTCAQLSVAERLQREVWSQMIGVIERNNIQTDIEAFATSIGPPTLKPAVFRGPEDLARDLATPVDSPLPTPNTSAQRSASMASPPPNSNPHPATARSVSLVSPSSSSAPPPKAKPPPPPRRLPTLPNADGSALPPLLVAVRAVSSEPRSFVAPEWCRIDSKIDIALTALEWIALASLRVSDEKTEVPWHVERVTPSRLEIPTSKARPVLARCMMYTSESVSPPRPGDTNMRDWILHVSSPMARLTLVAKVFQNVEADAVTEELTLWKSRQMKVVAGSLLWSAIECGDERDDAEREIQSLFDKAINGVDVQAAVSRFERAVERWRNSGEKSVRPEPLLGYKILKNLFGSMYEVLGEEEEEVHGGLMEPSADSIDTLHLLESLALESGIPPIISTTSHLATLLNRFTSAPHPSLLPLVSEKIEALSSLTSSQLSAAERAITLSAVAAIAEMIVEVFERVFDPKPIYLSRREGPTFALGPGDLLTLSKVFFDLNTIAGVSGKEIAPVLSRGVRRLVTESMKESETFLEIGLTTEGPLKPQSEVAPVLNLSDLRGEVPSTILHSSSLESLGISLKLIVSRLESQTAGERLEEISSLVTNSPSVHDIIGSSLSAVIGPRLEKSLPVSVGPMSMGDDGAKVSVLLSRLVRQTLSDAKWEFVQPLIDAILPMLRDHVEALRPEIFDSAIRAVDSDSFEEFVDDSVRHSSSGVDVAGLLLQTVSLYETSGLPPHPHICKLMAGIVNETLGQISELLSKETSLGPDLLPSPSSPSTPPPTSTLVSLSLRLNVADYLLTQLPSLTDQLTRNTFPARSTLPSPHSLLADSHTALSTAVTDLTKYIGIKIIWSDLREYVDRLYTPPLRDNSIQTLLRGPMNQVMEAVCELVTPLRLELVLLQILNNFSAVLRHVLLDGTGGRVFAAADGELFSEDLSVLLQFFQSGLDNEEVSKTLHWLGTLVGTIFESDSQQLIEMYHSTTLSSSDNAVTKENILKVLSHRSDKAAVAFVSSLTKKSSHASRLFG